MFSYSRDVDGAALLTDRESAKSGPGRTIRGERSPLLEGSESVVDRESRQMPDFNVIRERLAVTIEH